jgi:hypothetical protein
LSSKITGSPNPTRMCLIPIRAPFLPPLWIVYAHHFSASGFVSHVKVVSPVFASTRHSAALFSIAVFWSQCSRSRTAHVNATNQITEEIKIPIQNPVLSSLTPHPPLDNSSTVSPA